MQRWGLWGEWGEEGRGERKRQRGGEAERGKQAWGRGGCEGKGALLGMRDSTTVTSGGNGWDRLSKDAWQIQPVGCPHEAGGPCAFRGQCLAHSPDPGVARVLKVLAVDLRALIAALCRGVEFLQVQGGVHQRAIVVGKLLREAA